MNPVNVFYDFTGRNGYCFKIRRFKRVLLCWWVSYKEKNRNLLRTDKTGQKQRELN